MLSLLSIGQLLNSARTRIGSFDLGRIEYRRWPRGHMRTTFLIALLLLGAIGAAPATQRSREPAPVLQSSGPLRVAHYTKPFAPVAASASLSYHYDRYCYSTPDYGCYG